MTKIDELEGELSDSNDKNWEEFSQQIDEIAKEIYRKEENKDEKDNKEGTP